MAATWIKNVKDITWLRVLATLFFLALAVGIFTDWDDNAIAFKILIPFTYLYTWDNTSIMDVSVLIVPLLINIALWIPRYPSYVFLKVVFYVEYIKLLFVLPLYFLFLPFSPLFQRNNPAPIFFISLIVFFIIKELLSRLKKEEQVKYFKADVISERKQVWTLRIMIFAFCFIVFAGHILDMYITRDNLVPYASIKTHLLHHPKLKYKDFNAKDDNQYVYRDNPIESVADKVKLSLDGKQLLLRISSEDDLGKDLFIFDTENFANTKILQTSTIEQENRTTSGYTFTNDGKYVVVGDAPSKGSKISFQVIDIATGERDDRFSDPKGLSKVHLVKGVKVTNNIEFSRSGKYFAVVMQTAKIIEIWDYEQGELVFTDLLNDDIDKFIWLTDNKFLVACAKKSNKRTTIDKLEEYELLANGSVVRTQKNRVAYNMLNLYNRIWDIKSSTNGKFIAVYISKELDSDIAEDDVYSIWNIENDEKISVVNTKGIIKDIEFYSSDKKIITLEIFDNLSGKVTIWNIENGKKQSEILIPRTSNDAKKMPYKIKLIDSEKKLLIIGKAAHIVSLE